MYDVSRETFNIAILLFLKKSKKALTVSLICGNVYIDDNTNHTEGLKMNYYEIEYYDHFGIDGYCKAVTRVNTFEEVLEFYKDLKKRGGKLIIVWAK